MFGAVGMGTTGTVRSVVGKSSRSIWLLQEIDRLLAEIDAVLEGNDEQRPAWTATVQQRFPAWTATAGHC